MQRKFHTAGTEPELDQIQASKDGDPQAFNKLVQRYFGFVFAIGMVNLGQQRETAEDLTQEVFVRAYLSLDKLRNPVAFPAWLGRIARNMAMDWRRRGQRSSNFLSLIDRNDNLIEIPDERHIPANQVIEMEESRQALTEALNRLPQDQHEVLLMHFMEEMSQIEIAQIMDCSQAKVSRILNRALKSMRSYMETNMKAELKQLQSHPTAKMRTERLMGLVAVMPPAAKLSLASASTQALQTMGAIATTQTIWGNMAVKLITILNAIKEFYITGGRTMIAIKSLVTLLGVLTVSMVIGMNVYTAKAQNANMEATPTALELLDKYTESQKLFESISVKLRTTQSIDGAFSPRYKESLSNINKVRSLELIRDGEKYALRSWTWGKVAGNIPEVNQNNPMYDMRLNDGKIDYNYSIQPFAETLPNGKLMIQDEDCPRHVPYATIMSGDCEAVGDLFGYYNYLEERIDSHLRKCTNLSVRPQPESINGVLTYVIDAVTDSGKFSIWVAPSMDFNIVQSDVIRQQGDHFYEGTLLEGTLHHERVTNIVYEQHDGHWVPVSGNSTYHYIHEGGDNYYVHRTAEASEYVFKPDFVALRAFEAYDVRNGALTFVIGADPSNVKKCTWEDGKPNLE